MAIHVNYRGQWHVLCFIYCPKTLTPSSHIDGIFMQNGQLITKLFGRFN